MNAILSLIMIITLALPCSSAMDALRNKQTAVSQEQQKLAVNTASSTVAKNTADKSHQYPKNIQELITQVVIHTIALVPTLFGSTKSTALQSNIGKDIFVADEAVKAAIQTYNKPTPLPLQSR